MTDHNKTEKEKDEKKWIVHSFCFEEKRGYYFVDVVVIVFVLAAFIGTGLLCGATQRAKEDQLNEQHVATLAQTLDLQTRQYEQRYQALLRENQSLQSRLGLITEVLKNFQATLQFEMFEKLAVQSRSLASIVQSCTNGAFRLCAGQDFLIRELSVGGYRLVIQDDYNLVLYDHARAKWASSTFSNQHGVIYKMWLDVKKGLMIQKGQEKDTSVCFQEYLMPNAENVSIYSSMELLQNGQVEFQTDIGPIQALTKPQD